MIDHIGEEKGGKTFHFQTGGSLQRGSLKDGDKDKKRVVLIELLWYSKKVQFLIYIRESTKINDVANLLNLFLW